MKNPKQTQLQILKKREYTMYNFYINSNGTKEGPYSAAEMTALQLAATTPVTEQSYGDRWFTAKDFDFYYMAKEENVNQTDVVMTKDDFVSETACEKKQHTTTTLSDPSCLGKWCWRGFLMPGLWGIFNGVYWPLAVGLVSGLLSFVGLQFGPILLTIVTGIILGINGHSMSWDSLKGDIDAAKFDNRMAGWNVASVIITVAIILIQVVY